MKNNFTSPNGLRFFSELKKERISKINSLVNNLKFKDVENDTIFQQTSTRIKEQIMLTPVVIGEPEFVDHTYVETPLSFEQQLLGTNRNHYYHEYSFSFTGSKELFSYSPENGFSYSMSEHGLILPSYGNKITVYVDLPSLDLEKGKSFARNFLGMTYRLVESNNLSVRNWNLSLELQLDEFLKNKREELIKIFGNK